MAGYTPALTGFKLAFELSPIVLTGGVTDTFPGFALPIMAITESVNLPFSLLTGMKNFSVDQFFAHYQVLPGSTLVHQDIAHYPFANATIAANAVIAQPTNVSVLMICPVKNKIGWAEKLAIMTGLKFILDKHNALGGTYTVLTPAQIYTNCVMRGWHDTSSQLTKQVQNTYQFDFEKPLLTEDDAKGVLNDIAKVIKTGAKQVTDVFGLGNAGQISSVLPSLMPATAAQTSAQTIGAVTSTPAFPGSINPTN